MGDEVKVTVCKYPDRKNLVLRYVDPITGQQKTKSAKTAIEADAIKEAGKWEDELRTGRYQSASRLTWAEFRKRYEAEKLAGLAAETQATAKDSFNYLEREVNPDRVCKLTPQVMSRFQAKLRAHGLQDATIARHLRHVKAMLRWGERQGFIAKAPTIEMPKASKGVKLMKGRPITSEEFDRMLAAVPKIRPNDAPAWERLLRGLWLSGLRLGEALVLSWNEDAPFFADLTDRHPRFRILSKAQKSGRDEVLPMTPDFAQFLQATPEAERVDRVFDLTVRATGKPIVPKEVGRTISLVGEKAGVIVNKADGKYASAHDLRRSFGTRWAKRVMPAVLKRLMRHSAIQTTMNYYVDLDADEMANDLWAKFGESGDTPGQGNILGNSGQKSARTKKMKST
jgi:integrase